MSLLPEKQVVSSPVTETSPAFVAYEGKPIVRKCPGKSKQADCLQLSDHPNSRWECNFETPDKEEFQRHCKNILKRTKWREMVNNMKPDKDGLYHCVYFSTDRHHVENHYHKASNEGSPQLSPGKTKGSKRWYNYGNERRDFDDEEVEDEGEAGAHKKLRQDQGLLVPVIPDSMKVDEIVDNIQKKLELPQDMCQQAIEILHKQGFMIAAGLKNLKKDGWARLGLPLAIEEELKAQIMAKVYYSTSGQVSIATPNNAVGYNVLPLWTTQYWQPGAQVYSYVHYDQDGQPKPDEHGENGEHTEHSEDGQTLQTVQSIQHMQHLPMAHHGHQVDPHVEKIDHLDNKTQVVSVVGVDSLDKLNVLQHDHGLHHDLSVKTD